MRVRTLFPVFLLGLLACHKTEEAGNGPSASTGDGGPTSSTATSGTKDLRTIKKNLRAIWGSGPTDVWAAGDQGTIAHFDGKAWAASPSGTQENLTSLTGTGPSDVYAVGEKGAVLHWDGAAWKQVYSEGNATLFQLWASGPADVWAVGIDNGDDGGTMRHWNGTKWESQGIPGSSSLWGVGGSGPTDVWMVGTTSKGDGFLIQGNGKHFDAKGYKGPSARAVWCTRPDDVWVAPYQGPLQHWNGKDWAPAATPDGPWFRIGGSGADDVWAVGNDGLTAHFHGGVWTTPPSGIKEIVWSVWSASPTATWAVGNGGTVIVWDGKAWALDEHLNAP